MSRCKRVAITIARGWAVSRLFQSGGIVAWLVFGGNRYLREWSEEWNRFAVTFAQYAFLYMARHCFSRIIPMIWTHRSIVISLYSDIVMKRIASTYSNALICSLLCLSYRHI
jgi:hypothetical protein